MVSTKGRKPARGRKRKMKKTVYVVMEEPVANSGDSFDLYYTFDLNDARDKMAYHADRGYNLNKKSPKKTVYIIFGYAVDTDEIDEDQEYDVNDPMSLYNAYVDSAACVDHVYDEKFSAMKKKEIITDRDFTIITTARCFHPNLTSGDVGHIVEHDGELFFVYLPDEGYDIDSCWCWALEVERHFCVDEIDTDSYTYTTVDYKELDMEGLR